MMRFITLLAASSLLVCQCAGQEPVDDGEQDEFNELYPEEGPRYPSLNSLLGNSPSLYSAIKRNNNDRQLEMDMAAARAQQPFYPYGRRTDIPGRPSGFVFGKRGPYYIPYEKREMDEVNPYSVAKRDDELTGLGEYEASKRGRLSGLGSLSFGKRALGSNFAFGKRGYAGLSSFNFGKRAGLGSSFAFGKRGVPTADRFQGEDGLAQEQDATKRALGSSFTFGKRGNGLSSFAFGKRAGER